MTSPRLRGDGSTGVVCAAAALGEVAAHTVRRRANRRPVRLFMTSPRASCDVPPGRRKAPARTETATVTGRRRRAACASRQPRSLPWRRPSTNLQDGRNARPLGRSAARGRSAPSRRARWPPPCTASPTSGSTPRRHRRLFSSPEGFSCAATSLRTSRRQSQRSTVNGNGRFS